MDQPFYVYVAVGFVAQVVDGALGMAYGVLSSSLLLGFGMPPATASATVHAAECFTTGASAVAHRAFGNVNRELFRRLLIPGVLGAIIGAYVLASIQSDVLRPIVSGYLLAIGCVIVVKAFREFPPRFVTTRLAPLGFVGALLDALGCGGWGPIVSSTLIVRGNDPRQTVGSVNAVEFFVTVAASATFLLTLGMGHWRIVVGLAAGGLLGAPLGAWVCKRAPLKPLMIVVGLLVAGMSVVQLGRYFEIF